MANDIWKPSNPIVDWFEGHPWLAAIVSLIVPGLSQILMGHFLAGAIMLVLAALTWPFLLGWVIAIIAAIHAYKITPQDEKPDEG